MTVDELRAYLSNCPGDMEVILCTPTDDDGQAYHDIVAINHTSRPDQFLIIGTPEVHGKRFSLTLGDDSED